MTDQASPGIVDERTGLTWLRILGGEFMMGSEDSLPVHRVRIAPFEMTQTEVTREQYARYLGEKKLPKPPQWDHDLFARPGSPVIGVTFDDAVAYCLWAGGRLPTEAEWEFAARGTDGRRFPWGNTNVTRKLAVHHLDVGFGGTMPVASAPAGASPFGLLDMAGNAFEWCSDWYSEGYYAVSPRENPTGPAAGRLRVIRGGAWISLPDACTATARASYPPDKSSTLIGFRVAR